MKHSQSNQSEKLFYTTKPFYGLTLLLISNQKALIYVGFIEDVHKITSLPPEFFKLTKTLNPTISYQPKKFIDFIEILDKWGQHKINDIKQLKLDLNGTPFQILVWNELKKLDVNQIITYKALAQRINRPKAVRAVASAVGKNPIPIFIPCHRIVGQQNRYKYRAGSKIKKLIMNLEHNLDEVNKNLI